MRMSDQPSSLSYLLSYCKKNITLKRHYGTITHQTDVQKIVSSAIHDIEDAVGYGVDLLLHSITLLPASVAPGLMIDSCWSLPWDIKLAVRIAVVRHGHEVTEIVPYSSVDHYSRLETMGKL